MDRDIALTELEKKQGNQQLRRSELERIQNANEYD